MDIESLKALVGAAAIQNLLQTKYAENLIEIERLKKKQEESVKISRI